VQQRSPLPSILWYNELTEIVPCIGDVFRSSLQRVFEDSFRTDKYLVSYKQIAIETRAETPVRLHLKCPFIRLQPKLECVTK
jgi:hypothetical protein